MSGNRGRTRGRGAKPLNFDTSIAPVRNESPPSFPALGSNKATPGPSVVEDLFPSLQPLAAAMPASVWGKPAASALLPAATSLSLAVSALPSAAPVNPVEPAMTTPKLSVPKSETSGNLSDLSDQSPSETSSIGG